MHLDYPKISPTSGSTGNQPSSNPSALPVSPRGSSRSPGRHGPWQSVAKLQSHFGLDKKTDVTKESFRAAFANAGENMIIIRRQNLRSNNEGRRSMPPLRVASPPIARGGHTARALLIRSTARSMPSSMCSMHGRLCWLCCGHPPSNAR